MCLSNFSTFISLKPLINFSLKNWSAQSQGNADSSFNPTWYRMNIINNCKEIHEFEHISEKEMAPHSSTLAWKIPWTEEPGGLQSMGLLRVRHNWATSLWLFAFMHWRRKWQPTSVFFPGESQGRGSLVGCRLWGRTESDTTEAT